MAAASVFSKRYESADHEYECGSDVSTLRALSYKPPASSIRSGKSLRYVLSN